VSAIDQKRYRQPLRFAGRFLPLMGAFYALLYFPYGEHSLPGRMLEGYVRLQAAMAGGLLHLFDHSVSVAGSLVSGRFSLAIILDCAAVDAQALFAATLIAFPAPWKKKLAGLGAGILVITAANLARIIALYYVGVNWPQQFKFLHEDVFQFGIIAVTCAAFGLWALWVRQPSAEVPAPPGEAHAPA
jgi:exosortase/archaeosortase family protein